MTTKIMMKIIMFLCHIQYKITGEAGFFIKGHNDKYPRYLVYTEDEITRAKIDNIVSH